jgi:hypothetical protein
VAKITPRDLDRLQVALMLAFAGMSQAAEQLEDAMARIPGGPGSSFRYVPKTSRRIDEDADLPEWQVAFTRGPGTYNARDRLRFLGGKWQPDLLGGVWVVPKENADEAERMIRLAERSGEPLDADLKAEKITCYACGKKYAPFELRTLKGAVVEDWYCGCAEREAGPPPRRAQVRSR